MSSEPSSDGESFRDEKTRLILGGVSHKEVGLDFVNGIQQLAEDQGLPLRDISVGEFCEQEE